MYCQNHPEVPATAYIRSCGKPLCEECRRDAQGTVFCAEHVPATSGPPPGANPWTSPYPPPPPGPGAVYGSPATGQVDVNAGLAFFLGWIPGVGAIYNGQYAKGLVHAI